MFEKGKSFTMKIKQILSIALSAAMLFAMAGCQKQEAQPSVTALTQMEKINSKNIVDGSGALRLWYEVDPALFVNRVSGTTGNLKSVIQDLNYFSDGDPKKSEDDLGISGILLTNVISQDDSYAPKELSQLNPNIGSDDDLKALCEKSTSLGMPVMLEMELGSISLENSQFLAMTDLVNNLAEGEDPWAKDPVLMDEFYVEENHPNEDGWVQIGSSPYYYRAILQSNIPRINLDSHVWKQFIISAIEHYFSLGVSGFYIPDYNNLFPDDEQKDADFMKWFDSIAKERNENVINVFSYSSWNDPMAEIPAYAADAGAAGAEGMIAKAVTGAVSAKDLGNYFEANTNRTQNMTAYFLNNEDGSLDLLKSENRLAQYKMALALELMLNGQIFITAGDELGLTSKESDLIVDAIEEPAKQEVESGDINPEQTGTQVSLEFGSMEQQRQNGDSILNFVVQAIMLRDSYKSISEALTTVSQELSTDQVLVLDRKAENSETVQIFNLSDQPQTVDVSQVKISDLPAELGGVLLTNDGEITLNEGQLSLPPYSMALLK